MYRSFLPLLMLFVSGSLQAQNLLDELWKIRNKHQVPGMAFVVVGPQGIVQSGADGYGSLADSAPLSLVSAFHLGSNSKAVTSLVAQQMVQKGKISWKTTIAEVFPEWRKSMKPAYRKVTLADLLSHRSRLPAFTEGIEAAPWYYCAEGPACRLEFTRQVLQRKPQPKPGKDGYQYSNAGYVVASAMLERRGDSLSFENLVSLYANQILGSNMQSGWPRSNGVPGAAAGHFYRDSAFVAADEQAYRLGPVYVAPGNLYGTVIEQAAVLQFFLQAWTHQADEMSKSEAEWLMFGRPNYAFGWGHTIKNAERRAYHDGSAGTFYSRWIVVPDKQKAIVICANGAGVPTQAAIDELQQLLEKYFGL